MPISTQQTRGAVGSAQSDLRFVAFALGEHDYGINVGEIFGIYRGLPVTPVPNTSLFVEGEIQLANRRVPVVNLRRFAGMTEVTTDPESRWILIVNNSGGPVGLIVDRVMEVVRLTESNLNLPDDVPPQVSDYISAMASYRGHRLFLPDLGRLLYDAV
jgi:purine-binding chemotaxis protein CheW